MFEWMHDETVVKDMQADFSSKTLEDCNLFIHFSKKYKYECKICCSHYIFACFFGVETIFC